MTKCPQCGYEEVPTPKERHSIMNKYVTADGKKTVFMNRLEERFDAIKGEGKDAVTIQWVRKDIFDKIPQASVPITTLKK